MEETGSMLDKLEGVKEGKVMEDKRSECAMKVGPHTHESGSTITVEGQQIQKYIMIMVWIVLFFTKVLTRGREMNLVLQRAQPQGAVVDRAAHHADHHCHLGRIQLKT